MLDGIKRINEGLAMANNLPKDLYPKLNMVQSVTSLKNDTAMVKKVNKDLEAMVGPGKKFDKFPTSNGLRRLSLSSYALKKTSDYFLWG